MIDLKIYLPYICLLERLACNNIFTVNECQPKQEIIQRRARNSLNITI
jgi:hypothetical protein